MGPWTNEYRDENALAGRVTPLDDLQSQLNNIQRQINDLSLVRKENDYLREQNAELSRSAEAWRDLANHRASKLDEVRRVLD